MTDTLHICLIAGEPSGDVLGARLIRALKAAHGDHMHLSGVGGPLMQAEGLTSLFPMEELSVMGVMEVLPRLPNLIRRINQVARHIQTESVTLVVTIDSPDFSFRVAKKVHELCHEPPRMVHYVAPTVWAWRPERAAKLARLYDGVMCLFPFEPPYFEKEGMHAAFVGHPVMETYEPLTDKGAAQAALKTEWGVPLHARLVGVFPGSRRGEIKRMGPLLAEAVRNYARKHEDIVIVAPTLPHIEDRVTALLADMPCPVRIISTPDKGRLYAALDMAVATSGTVGLELAVAGVPHVIGYRFNALSWQIIKRKLTTRFAHLVNILLDRAVVPELIQDDCTADRMEAALARLAQDNDGVAQLEAFAAARQLLSGVQKDRLPSEQAASFVLQTPR